MFPSFYADEGLRHRELKQLVKDHRAHHRQSQEPSPGRQGVCGPPGCAPLSLSTRRPIIRAHCPLWGMVICFVGYSFLGSLSLPVFPVCHFCLHAPLPRDTTYVFLNGDFHGARLQLLISGKPQTGRPFWFHCLIVGG